MNKEEVLSIVEKHNGDRGSLISILEDMQAKYGYLSEEALRLVAAETGRSLVDIYGVATFYRAFSLKPRGKHLVSVCLGTACHVRGGPAIARELERQLGIKPGETTPDREFTFETVNCLGACALGPVVVIDGKYFPKVKSSMVGDILAKARVGIDLIKVDDDERIFPVEVSCARCNHSLMDPRHVIEGHPAVRVTAYFDGKHGWLAISSLWGSYTVHSEHEIPAHTVVTFFCPHCHAEMKGGSGCADCGAPMVPMIVRSGGVVQLCSRRGCKGHMLDLSGAAFD